LKRPGGFSWHDAKHAGNLEKHGVSFEAAKAFEFDTALVATDDRKDYGETREVALGLIDDRLHTLVFTMRGTVCHVISLRKSNKREIETYVENL
jgi:uncharacterized protein